MTRAISAAIVGAGLMGRWHAHACEQAGGHVVAIVDLDHVAAGTLARKYGRCTTAARLDDLPESVEVDAVHVCTPLASHVDEVRAAMRHARVVVVEKPIAPTADLTGMLLGEAVARGVILVPVHQMVFQEGFRRARTWLNERPPRIFDYRACSAGATAEPDRADEIVADILPHPLSLIDALLPGATGAMQWRTEHVSSGEWIVDATSGHTAVRLLISMHARPPRHELVLFADDGTINVDLFHGFAWREGGATSRTAKIARPFTTGAMNVGSAAVNLAKRVLANEPAYPGLTALVRQAYASVADPGRRPFTDQHVIDVSRARDAILQQIARA